MDMAALWSAEPGTGWLDRLPTEADSLSRAVWSGGNRGPDDRCQTPIVRIAWSDGLVRSMALGIDLRSVAWRAQTEPKHGHLAYRNLRSDLAGLSAGSCPAGTRFHAQHRIRNHVVTDHKHRITE